MDCGTSKCSNYPFFLISFYMIYLTNLIRPSFFAERQKKTKTRADFKKRGKKREKAVSSASIGEIWLILEDFDSRVLCSPALLMSVVGNRCELSAQGDCDVGVERPPGH